MSRKLLEQLNYFPSGSDVKNLPAMQETSVQSQVGKIPWRRAWQPTPVVLPGYFHGQRSLVGYSPWGCKGLDGAEKPNSLGGNQPAWL